MDELGYLPQLALVQEQLGLTFRTVSAPNQRAKLCQTQGVPASENHRMPLPRYPFLNLTAEKMELLTVKQKEGQNLVGLE